MAKVLVVDDEHSQVEVLVMLLSSEGFEVAEASNGKDALERLDGVRPDLVLTDYMMPLMNGGEMAKRIRSTPHAAIPIIMTSATEAKQVEHHAEHYDAFVRKPYKWDDLLEIIKSLLSSGRPGASAGVPSR